MLYQTGKTKWKFISIMYVNIFYQNIVYLISVLRWEDNKICYLDLNIICWYLWNVYKILNNAVGVLHIITKRYVLQFMPKDEYKNTSSFAKHFRKLSVYAKIAIEPYGRLR
jgi:hypothetical protein